MKLDDFIKTLQLYQREIGTPGEGAHPNIKGDIEFEDMDGNVFEVVEVEPITTMGCGCWIHTRVILKPATEDK